MTAREFPNVLTVHRAIVSLVAAGLASTWLLAAPEPGSPFLPIADVHSGMVGVGRTVFAGNTIDDFSVHILGVLHNIIGPNRDLILAKLEGGPLATTGVIAGMSGSPVYVDGRLIGAVSYALGSFPKEPFAGITPISEMTGAIDAPGPRPAVADLTLSWPATPADVFGTLQHLAERSVAPIQLLPRPASVSSVGSLADLAPALRPIGAAMVMSGFAPGIDAKLRDALAPAGTARPSAGRQGPVVSAAMLHPGDPVGVSLIRGDLEMGATGTVTYVDGERVYAFGHPFLNLGPAEFAMTQPHVYAVLPSLDSSLKIATLGPVIGTLSQDRSTAVGGTLGAGPREVQVSVTLSSAGSADQHFAFQVVRDQLLTPLMTYTALLNALSSYERQAGALSIAASGSVSFGADGRVAIDNFFTGDSAPALAAEAATEPIGIAATNKFRSELPESLDLHLTVAEEQRSSTIERAWLDTTRPKIGHTYNLQVLMRDYRGGAQTVSLPITMPSHAAGPLTLLVSDAATLSGIEKHELKPGAPTNIHELIEQMNDTRRNNRLYVRLLTGAPGAVVAGQTLPSLPPSVRSVLDADTSVASAPMSRTVVGAWEQRFDRAITGSRQLTLTLAPAE